MTQELHLKPPARARAHPAAGDQPADRPGEPARPADRSQRVEALLDELTSQTPAEAIRFMRRWHAGPLSLIHLHVMTLLQEGAVPMRSLAESIGVSQASATGIVDRMEQRGLVERRREDDDRRVIRVQLAPEGRELLASVSSDRRHKLGYLLSELTDDELDGFLRGARALRRARDRYLERAAAGDVPTPATDEATR